MKKFGLLLFLLSILPVASASAAIVNFTPDLDADIQANNSALNPYDSDTNQTNAPAGIPDDLVMIFSDTYFFEDFTTGIGFSFDVEWSAVGGNLNGTTTILGVGDTDIEGSETLTVSVSNLNVDFANYFAGSVGSIVAPTLDNATISFDMVRFADRTSTVADESVVDISNGTSTVSWGTAAGGVGDNLFMLGSDGFSTSETSLTLSHNAISTDTDFNLASTRFDVEIEFSESAVAVPEPGSLIGFALICGMMAGRRKR